jgi:hypothetical protein
MMALQVWRRKWSRLLGLVVLGGLGWPALGDAFLVKDGQPQAEIVVAAAPPRMTRMAAQELQAYVEKISGAKLAIVTNPTPGVAAQVYVGRSGFTDRLNVKDEGLNSDAFRLVSGPNYLVLLGRDSDFKEPETYIKTEAGGVRNYERWDALTGGTYGNPMSAVPYYDFNQALKISQADERGSLNAVYEFLRLQGVRWYMPGEIGEVVPRAASIALPKIDRTVRPDFSIRNMAIMFNDFGRGKPDYVMWQLRLGLNQGRELTGLGSGFGHGLLNVHARNKAHPEWFALFDGKRAVTAAYGQGNPCLSAEGLFQETLKYAEAFFRIYPDQRMIDLGPVDGYSSLCQCELCKDKGTFDRGWNGRMSDYVWGFVNRVATELYKTHPDRRVNCVAYSGYQLPPLKIAKMSPNVTVTVCRWRSEFDDSEKRDAFRKITEAWLEKLPSKELYIWDYYLHGRPGGPWDGVPVYFPRLVAEDLGYLKGKSKGDFVEVQGFWPAWKLNRDVMAANHLNVYVTARMYWDASQDLDALLADYYGKFYGPAAAPMKAFVDYAEANWQTSTKDAKVIDRLVELLAAARKAAGDTVYGKRVDLLSAFMQPLLEKRDTIAVGRKGVPVMEARKREKADLTLDGKLDEPFWKDLKSVPLLDLATGKPPANPGSFKVAWAEDSLYLGIVCEESDLKTLNIGSKEDENTNIFNGDNVELLIETPTHAYYQIGISPTGAIVDMDRKGGMNTLWSSQGKVVAHSANGAWTLEIRLPAAGASQEELDALHGISGSLPTDDQPWYINVCRQRLRGEERELSAFSPTGADSFHVLMKFGKLVVK